MTYNLLYCFDENYNFQAFSSIISILDNSYSKFNIYIIHKNETNQDFIPEVIKNHKNLNNIKVFKFNLHSKFPDIENTHVSEATYYRIFFDSFIDETVEYLTYIDADIICNKDPSVFIDKAISEIDSSTYLLAAKTERIKEESNEHIFNRIEMKSDKYFNAGVMVINAERWRAKMVGKKLMNRLNNINFKLNFWDQDLFNIFFDGEYIQIDKACNWNIVLEYTYSEKEETKLFDDIVFFHFYGKTKPWVSRGLYSKYSYLYQNNFRKISHNYYHISHNYFPNSLIQLFSALFNLNFFKYIEKKRLFLFIFLKNYLTKKSLNNET
jgi:lipopolysaccharide biosynthesis glycosyltransferase